MATVPVRRRDPESEEAGHLHVRRRRRQEAFFFFFLQPGEEEEESFLPAPPPLVTVLTQALMIPTISSSSPYSATWALQQFARTHN